MNFRYSHDILKRLSLNREGAKDAKGCIFLPDRDDRSGKGFSPTGICDKELPITLVCFTTGTVLLNVDYFCVAVISNCEAKSEALRYSLMSKLKNKHKWGLSWERCFQIILISFIVILGMPMILDVSSFFSVV